MKIIETIRDAYFISTDKSKLNVSFIHDFLCNKSYCAKNIPVETVQKSIDGSFCFGLFLDENKNAQTLQTGIKNYKQVGFARVITDHATFAYLADVFIIDEFRGMGLAKCPPG